MAATPWRVFECTQKRPFSIAAVVDFVMEPGMCPGTARHVEVVHENIAPTGYCRNCWMVLS